MTNTYNLYQRQQFFVNTDPQQRCYNGCYFSGEYRWSGWELLQNEVPESQIDERLKFWQELNDYAVSQRGKSAKKEFKKVLSNETVSQIP